MSHDITQFLEGWNAGDDDGLNKAVALLYSELQQAARNFLYREKTFHTLQATALVNEVYVRLSEGKRFKFENRTQFLWFASRIMRQILVDHSRNKKSLKRGEGERPIQMEDINEITGGKNVDPAILIALDDALTRLEQLDPRQAKVVELRYFTGLDLAETAEVLGTSVTTVKREWTFVKRWLARELNTASN